MALTFELEEIMVMMEELSGVCVNCGETHIPQIDPDGRDIHCDVCGELAVYGAEEALIMGYVS